MPPAPFAKLKIALLFTGYWPLAVGQEADALGPRFQNSVDLLRNLCAALKIFGEQGARS